MYGMIILVNTFADYYIYIKYIIFVLRLLITSLMFLDSVLRYSIHSQTLYLVQLFHLISVGLQYEHIDIIIYIKLT